MKALTIWQPWASLIMAGAKPIEFRKWPAPKSIVGQRIVIHAAARTIRISEFIGAIECAQDTSGRSLGGGMAHLAKAMDLYDAWNRGGMAANHFPLSAGIGTAVLGQPVKCVEFFAGQMDPDEIDEDKWCWPLTDIEPFKEPIPMRGFQGFWNWPEVKAG